MFIAVLMKKTKGHKSAVHQQGTGVRTQGSHGSDKKKTKNTSKHQPRVILQRLSSVCQVPASLTGGNHHHLFLAYSSRSFFYA